ncbi:glycosyltransferase [Streptomyces polygonati]|uniref:Glycosyltransferase n=1 Tax=Streptomyces polygonati TaxID=1617087 RepID=A0ABV8HIZ9_9ACTN
MSIDARCETGQDDPCPAVPPTGTVVVPRPGEAERHTAAVGLVTVDIAIPVHNEQKALPGCVSALHDFLHDGFPFPWTITLVDSGSTDDTRRVAEELALVRPRVRVLHQDRKGKGFAVRTAWLRSEADVVVYMDVDLSTGLDALLPLVAALAGGHSDIAIGSRYAPGARVVRGTKRALVSRGYNALLRWTHRVRFTDAQCGFKAARAEVIRPLLRSVADDAWFFDTEMLLLAQHNKLRLHEVAVDWIEDTDSRVVVRSVAAGNLRGVLRLARARLSGAATVHGLPPRPAPRAVHPDAVLAPGRPARTRRWALASAPVSLAALALYLRTRRRGSPSPGGPAPMRAGLAGGAGAGR